MNAQKAITRAQIMIKESERAALCKSHQPNRELGEFDREAVQVHAVKTALGNKAFSDQKPIVETTGQWFPASYRIANGPIDSNRASIFLLPGPGFD